MAVGSSPGQLQGGGQATCGSHHAVTRVTKSIHNANGLLSLATQYYAYTGGAHGNYETVLHNIDVAEGKQLTYESLFSPETNDQLLQLLKSAASEYENTHPTKNIALTKDGILFDYPPYEIASYAEGEIEVILPYEEVAIRDGPGGSQTDGCPAFRP